MVNRDVSLLRTIVVHRCVISGGSPKRGISGRLFSFGGERFFGAATLL